MKEEIRTQAKRIAAIFGKTYEQKQDIEGRCLEAAWQSESKVDKTKNPQSFIKVVMKNAAIDYLRKQNKVEISLGERDVSINPEDSIVEDINIKKEVELFVATLVYPDKEIVTMLIEGSSLKEIAKELKMKPGAIAVRIHRNKDTWKEHLKL